MFTKRALWSITLLPLVALWLVAREKRQGQDGDLVLFAFDNESIPWRENLKLTLEQPRKYPGNPVLKSGPADSIDGYGAVLYGSVLDIGGKLRMWYLAWPQPDSRFPGDTERYRPVAYAESKDGIHWIKPDLGLVTFRGNTKNNIVSIEPASEPYARPMDFISVLYDIDDPDASRRYKMAYIVEDNVRKIASTATAVSPDGLHWQLVNKEPFTRGHFENTSLIRFNGLYYASGQNLSPWGGQLLDGTYAGRTMTTFFSTDFRRWAGGRALSFHRAGYVPKPIGMGQEAHMGGGLWNRGNVVLGLYGRWYGDTITGRRGRLDGLTIDLGLIISNDAIHYREPIQDFVFLKRGEGAAWDSVALLQGNAFRNTDTETQIWYSHWNTGAAWPQPALPEKAQNPTPSAIGLATLPRDRFGYVAKQHTAMPARGTQAPLLPQSGEFLTKSISLTKPSRVFINATDVAANAPLKIDLVNDAEETLPGYSSELTTPGLKQPLRWAGAKLTPAEQPFRIRVRWPPGQPNPKLYVVYVEQP